MSAKCFFSLRLGGKKDFDFFPIERVNSRLEIRRLLFLISNTPRPSIPVYKGKGFFKKTIRFGKVWSPFYDFFYLSRCVVVSNSTMKKWTMVTPHPIVYYSLKFSNDHHHRQDFITSFTLECRCGVFHAL